MILVVFNKANYEYDVHSLIKAFFPKEDVCMVEKASPEESEQASSVFYINFFEDSFSIAWKDEKEEVSLTSDKRRDIKNALKQTLYQMLAKACGGELPWGTLTGIRPTKIPMKLLEEGKSEGEAFTYMKDTYLASDEKIRLAIEIAQRERHLLNKIDYENGYSLYIILMRFSSSDAISSDEENSPSNGESKLIVTCPLYLLIPLTIET